MPTLRSIKKSKKSLSRNISASDLFGATKKPSPTKEPIEKQEETISRNISASDLFGTTKGVSQKPKEAKPLVGYAVQPPKKDFRSFEFPEVSKEQEQPLKYDKRLPYDRPISERSALYSPEAYEKLKQDVVSKESEIGITPETKRRVYPELRDPSLNYDVLSPTERQSQTEQARAIAEANRKRIEEKPFLDRTYKTQEDMEKADKFAKGVKSFSESRTAFTRRLGEAGTLGLGERLVPRTEEQEQAIKESPIASNLGMLAGYIAPGTQLSKGAESLVKKGTEKITSPLIKKLLGKKSVQLGVQEGIAGVGLGATEGTLKGESPLDVVKRSAEYGAYGALGVPAIMGTGKVINKVLKETRKAMPKPLRVNLNNIGENPFKGVSELGGRKGKLQASGIADSGKYSVTNRAIQGAEKTYKQAIEDIKAKYGEDPKKAILGKVKPDITPTGLGKKGKYKVANRELESALDEYHEAILTIQNKYGTDDVRGAITDIVNDYNPKMIGMVDEEFANQWIKENDNIDLDDIVRRVESAEKIQPISRENLARRESKVTIGLASEDVYKAREGVRNISKKEETKLIKDYIKNKDNIDLDELKRVVDEANANKRKFASETKFKVEEPLLPTQDDIKLKGGNLDRLKNVPKTPKIPDDLTESLPPYTGDTKIELGGLNKLKEASKELPKRKEGLEKYIKTMQTRKDRGLYVDLQLFAEAEAKLKSLNPEYKITNLGESANKSTRQKLTEEIDLEMEGATKTLPSTNVSDFQKIKDKSGLSYNAVDFYRNIERTFKRIPELHKYVKRNIVDVLNSQKKNYVKDVSKYTSDLRSQVVNKFNIQKGSRASGGIQKYGEGVQQKVIDKELKEIPYTLDDLKKEFPNKWEDIVEAEKFFRKSYDELIVKVNNTRAKIFPNNPDKIVPSRKDYFRHFQEMQEGFLGLRNIFEGNAMISPGLEAISSMTQPKSKWASFMQKRGIGKYKADAVGGFLDYVKPASYAINIDPVIPKIRELSKMIAEGTEQTKNANNLIMYLRRFADDLAGKSHPIDRPIQELVGRKFVSVGSWLNSRTKANAVLGNFGSMLSQTASIPTAIATVKNPKHLSSALKDVAKSIVGKDEVFKNSPFLKERFLDKELLKFDKKIIEQPIKGAKWTMATIDEMATKYIWSANHRHAIAKNIENPVAYADDITRKLVAGRGIGEVPLLQKSKLVQVIAPFQIEVNNLWHIMKDFTDNKEFGSLATLLIANSVFNLGYEKIFGRKILFDPLKAIVDAIGEEDVSILERFGRLGGETLSNVQFGQTFANMGFMSEAQKEKYFGSTNPSRFGQGVLAGKAFQEPQYNILTPFGGKQIKKTVEGVESLKKDVPGVYSKDDTKLKYPIDPTTINKLKVILFGKYSTPEANEYFKNKRVGLTEKQTEKVVKSSYPQRSYDKIIEEREKRKEKNKK